MRTIRFPRRSPHATTVVPAARTTAVPSPCRWCEEVLDHCHATLVLHADGTAACDEADACGGREDLHDWWIPCTDLGCGCTGDEGADPLPLLAAA